MASLAFASPGLAADRVEPLNQHIVTGTDAELGSLGYDVSEGADATDRCARVPPRDAHLHALDDHALS
jgi:hypothetical protein